MSRAIEARLYAEDVEAGFLPVSGRVERLFVETTDVVRMDSGYGDGATVSTFYDAMFGEGHCLGADARLGDPAIERRAHARSDSWSSDEP